MMGTEATATTTVSGGSGRAAPAALCLQAARGAWSRTSKVLDVDAASPTAAPSLGSSVGVPFLWEEAPGRPKVVVVAPEDFAPPLPAPDADDERTPVSHGGEAAPAGGGDRGDGDTARHVVAPLKLPPRLQAAAAAAAAADSSLSPNTVLHGPYGGNKPPRPLTRSGSTASHRRKPIAAGVSLWKKATAAARGKRHDHDAAALDAPCRSPASSSSSSSSSSMSYFADDDHRRQTDGHGDPEPEADGEECGAKSTVRITRFKRNKSLPSVNTSHLWASIRRSVKQITPWS
uniref:Uncharacterized protein n=1 Tax=Oryza meridionalis TaxID=40149 RepID=A0A0E0C3G8_9ORYZ